MARVLVGIALSVAALSAHAADRRPNILLIVADNLGYGELGSYGGGITRGAPTPRLDDLARQGTRLTNFNVEPSCTPTRSALMTGRHPIRSGTYIVPLDGSYYGLVQWEITLAEVLSEQGYATAHHGKWHLGDSEGRLPNDQGFDEWYGIANSSDESWWAQDKRFDAEVAHLPQVMEGRRGQKSRSIKVYDEAARRQIDTELADRTIAFMQRSARQSQAFFAYVPLTQPHMPVKVSNAFDGKTSNGPFADMLAEMDHNVGRMLDALEALQIENDTIVIFTSDNGPEELMPWRGSAGPWTGTYNTAMEGSLRVPFIVRWPGKVPTDRVSNQMMHVTDLFATLAALGGATVPTDRAIDGIDQTRFLLGETEQSSREFIPVFHGNAAGQDLYAVKWRRWKMHYYWQERKFDPPIRLSIPRLIDLYANPQERIEETIGETSLEGRAWIAHGIFAEQGKFLESLKRFPPIPAGTPDPYVPTAPQ